MTDEPATGASSPASPAANSPGGLAGVVVRGAGIAGGGYAVAQIISFGTYLALARLITPRDFGTYAAGTVVVGIGLVVGESGLLAALIQRHDRLEEAFNSALLASLAGGVALALLGLAAAPLIGLFFHNHSAELVAAAMAGTMFARLAIIVPSARLQRNFSFLRRVVIDPLGSLAFAAGSVIGGAAGLGAWALVIGVYAQVTVDLVAAWTLARWRPRPRTASLAMWRELARFGRPIVAAELVRRVTAEVPVLALGRFAGARALGEFSYALRVATQPINAIVDVGAYVILPAFARIAPDRARFQASLLRALRWICAIAFPFGLLLIPLGRPAIVITFGSQWREAGDAAMALGVYCAALALDSIASEAWKAAGRPGMLPRMHGVSLLLTVLFVAGFVALGAVGVSIGMALSAIGVGAYAVHGISTVVEISVRRLVHEIWPPVAAAAVMASVLLATDRLIVHADRHGLPLGLVLLVAEGLLGAAIYLSCLAALAPETRRELQQAVTQRRERRAI